MTKRWGVLLLGAAVIAVVAFFLLKTRDREQRSAHAKSAGTAEVAPATASAAEVKKDPARAQVSVVDASGPVANATVRLAHDGDVTLVQTGTDGVARADDLEAGEWSISASADGHEPAAATTRELHAGETAKIDIKLAAGGRALSGLVTDASGGPIAGARIDAAKLGALARPSDAVASTTTGSDGRYKLQVADGQLLVSASEASYAPQSKLVEVGAAGATADFALVPGGVIEGIVRDEKTREAVAGAHVVAQRDAPAMTFRDRSRRRVVTGADGRFRITGLRPGAYDLDARAQRRTSQSP
ncbi:MAG: carboxypeptidase regulatory-like domain-containing protein, partial [Kofleriaceae bacterium]|nr:carboxypeptidase regulatory-like domain-containing protein [Kofleriaceae bacterium]